MYITHKRGIKYKVYSPEEWDKLKAKEVSEQNTKHFLKHMVNLVNHMVNVYNQCTPFEKKKMCVLVKRISNKKK
tara:strand:- start:389 stop:610 length:222 start_codon:yes stop_codon:yes gene_type:complete